MKLTQRDVPLLTAGSLSDLVESAKFEGSSGDLPGLTLKEFTLATAKDWDDRADLYMFGVAADGTKTDAGAVRVQIIPFGAEDIAKNTAVNLVTKVDVGVTISYVGVGLPLVLPPVSGFLAFRLFFVDSDSTARDAAKVIKSVAEVVGSKEAAIALALTGLTQAAAFAYLAGKALGVASDVMTQNLDDVIQVFEGYLTPAMLQSQDDIVASDPNANARFGHATS